MNNIWDQLCELANVTEYGMLDKQVENNSTLSYLVHLHDNYNIGSNPAVESLRAWLKIYETDPYKIHRCSSLLEESIKASNRSIDETKHLAMVIKRLKNYPVWTTSARTALHKYLKNCDVPILRWHEIDTSESLTKTPFNVLLIHWCDCINNKGYTPTASELEEVQSINWSPKARCMLAGTMIQNIGSYQSREKMWALAEKCLPGVRNAIEPFIEDTSKEHTYLAQHLLNSAMSTKEKKKEDTVGSIDFTDITFTAEW